MKLRQHRQVGEDALFSEKRRALKRLSVIVGVLLGLLAFAAESSACSAPTCTKIIDNGSDSGKKVVVVMGDGYTSTEQSTYNTQVSNLVNDGMFGHGFFGEVHNAFNVYRLNLPSIESGVSQRVWDLKGTPNDASDDTIVSTTMKDTALRYIFNGAWSHCWLEHDGGNTNTRKNNALSANGLSHADYIIVILNEGGFGGCNRGPRDIVQTRSIGWQVVAHEAGHGIGGLMDEYTRPGAYAGSTINNRNCSTVTDRSTNFWNRFIHPFTPIPTTFSSATMDPNRTVGIFPGCRYKTSGIYRPVHNCRMRGNTPNYCPVCQTLMRGQLHGNLGHNFLRAVAGDFNGDGRDDVLIQNSSDWAIYRAGTGPRQLERVWTANNSVPGSGHWPWPIRSGDSLHVADFTGDGRDDIFVLNRTSWGGNWLVLLASNGTGLETVRAYSSVPGYGQIRDNDRIFVADFNGDVRDDLYLFSGSSSSTSYLGMLLSGGTHLGGVRRYDNIIPGAWAMKKGDRFYVGDFDNDGKDDLYVFNPNDWSKRYLGMLKSEGNKLSRTKLYTTSLPGWTMTKGDRFYVGDFNGDDLDDLYVFNGSDWCCAYLLMTRSTGAGLSFVRRYNDGASDANNIPGWKMRKGDRFWIADANKDNRDDLFVYNPKINWSTEYLGTLMSTGNALAGSSSADWVLGIPGAGGWNLGTADSIIPVNYEGGPGKADIFIRNRNWFGMIRRAPMRFVMDRHYHKWIYSPLHDSKPWQTGLP